MDNALKIINTVADLLVKLGLPTLLGIVITKLMDRPKNKETKEVMNFEEQEKVIKDFCKSERTINDNGTSYVEREFESIYQVRKTSLDLIYELFRSKKITYEKALEMLLNLSTTGNISGEIKK